MTNPHHWPVALRTVEEVGAGRALLLRVVRLLIGRHGQGLKRDTTFAANIISQVAQVSCAGREFERNKQQCREQFPADVQLPVKHELIL
jgi:hypothetical protein